MKFKREKKEHEILDSKKQYDQWISVTNAFKGLWIDRLNRKYRRQRPKTNMTKNLNYGSQLTAMTKREDITLSVTG